jgi:general secretion pathway protein K
MTRVLREERGMALLLVLMIVAMLAALLTEFAFSTLVDLRLTETFRDSTRAYYLAKGGVTVGRGVLQLDTNEYTSRDELWAQGVPNYPVGDGVVSVFIEDQGGRLDVNALVDAADNVNPVVKLRFYRFFEVMGLEDPEGLTGAMIDWLDGNDVPYNDPDNNKAMIGAESDYYLRLEPPYPCNDGPIASLGELGLIRGFTPEVLQSVAPHLTVYGGTTINVNTASAEVLMSLSEDPEIDRDTAEAIIARRDDEPYRSPDDLKELNDLPGMENLVRTPFGVTSTTFRIESEGGVGDGVRRMEAFVQKTGDKLLYIKVN